MTPTISGSNIQTDLNDFSSISISSEEDVIDLSEHILHENTALMPIEPKRCSILTNDNILIALATGVIMVATGAFFKPY